MAKNNREYWGNRLDEIAQKQFDLTYADMERELKKIYKQMTDKIVSYVDDLAFKILDEELSRTDIWTYKHFKDLLKSINEQLIRLGMAEINILNGNLETALSSVYSASTVPVVAGTVAFAAIDQTMVKMLVARAWSTKHFTSTVWTNKQQLLNLLKDGIAQSVVLGRNKDKLVAEVMRIMGVGFNAADRVVRTELMHTINAGQVQRYTDNGYKELEILVAHDERLCPSCGERDGDIVKIDSGDIPPFHPRCRCTVIPVIE